MADPVSRQQIGDRDRIERGLRLALFRVQVERE
jgi:hypothetical protein